MGVLVGHVSPSKMVRCLSGGTLPLPLTLYGIVFDPEYYQGRFLMILAVRVAPGKTPTWAVEGSESVDPVQLSVLAGVADQEVHRLPRLSEG